MSCTFQPGQVVVATGSYAHQIIEGKRYTVIGSTPRLVTPTFTWPEYVTVMGDFGKQVEGHTWRFRPLKEGET